MRQTSGGKPTLTGVVFSPTPEQGADMRMEGGGVVLTHARFSRAPVCAPLLTKAQVAAAAGVSTRTVDRWVERGLPRDTHETVGAWCYLGQRRRFRLAETLAWLDEHGPV